jgi:hypothetical protein
MLACLMLACSAAGARAQSAATSAELRPRAFGVLRLGPAGRTVVRANTREVAGVSTPAPGIGARLDVPILRQLLIGFDLGMLFEGESELRPQSPDGSYELHAEGMILDAVISARPVWRLASDRIELYGSLGVGLALRPSTSFTGFVPRRGEEDGTAFSSEDYPETSGLNWGVLAQVGAGGTFWLSSRFAVFVELAILARQTHAVIDDSKYGDYLLRITDAQGVLLVGFGASIGGR